MVTSISKETSEGDEMKALDRLINSSKGQIGTPFEASLKVERNTSDFNIFAEHNDNEAISSLSTTASVVEGEISVVSAIENTVMAMRGQSAILKSMAVSVTPESLNTIAKVYSQVNKHSIDVNDLYNTNKDYRNLINAMANGFIVTAGIERVIANPIKLYFLTPLDERAVDLNLKAGYQFKGNLPCIRTFDADSVNKVQTFVRTVASQVSTACKGLTLFDFINSQGSKFKAPTVHNDTLFNDRAILKGMDVKQLAEYLTSKFAGNLDFAIQFARDNGVGDNKLQKVSMLIKAIRDYTN